MQNRVVPQRMCVACRRLFDKRDLLRVVRSPEGEVFFDPSGKAAGRGAYLCKDPECLKKAVKTKVLNKLFKAEISDEAYQKLREYYES
ncbi:MAG: YlxR family protein [Clostridia bacterium]|nr:YlxR family protein [Clostridia bacterium]